jgi:hypothetical protein
MPRVSDALAAHYRPAADAPTLRTVALIGATGRLGEAVLEALIAAPNIKQVAVAVNHPLQTTEDKVLAVFGNANAPIDWRAAAVTDAIIVIDTASNMHSAPLPHLAGKRRDAVYTKCAPQDWLDHATQLHGAGVQRLAIIIPAEGWLSRPEATRGLLATQDEFALASLGFTALLLVRPEQESGASQAARTLSVSQRIAYTLLRQLRFMLPQQTPITTKVLARWVVQRLAGLHDGVAVVETQQIAEELGLNEKRRRY